VSYGSVNDGATVTNQIPYTIPAGATCGNTVTINITGTSSLGAMNPSSITVRLGAPVFSGGTQNFDGVTAPALPGAWNNVQLSGTGINWVTTVTAPNSAPNAAFANDPGSLNDAALVTSVKVTSATAQIAFKNKFTTESTFDGAVMEYSTDGGNNWTDFCPNCSTICPGASCPFVSGGYTQTISTGFSSPIGGRRAWAGTQAAFLDTVVNVPAALNGQTIQIRWRMASDTSVSGTGITIDDVVVTGGQLVTSYACSNAPSVRSRADFDGDGKSDFSVFRPSEGNWYLLQSQAGFGAVGWGVSTDTLTPGDFNGDGKTDFAVFRPNADPAQSDFYILNNGSFTVTGVSWGLPGDTPVIADYDGDSKSDIAIYRASDHTFYALLSAGGTIVKPYGIAGDVPVAGDFIGDSKADITLFRPSTNQWWIFNGAGDTVVQFGQAGDIVVPADYNGDNKDDIAVFRPSNGAWIYLPSGGGNALFTNFGAAGDVPSPGDFDGDGKDDPTIYRNGQWWSLRSTAGVAVANFGLATDKSIPKAYLP